MQRALSHSVLEEARAAQSRGQCYREAPFCLQLDDGSLLEGVIDLLFRSDEQWQVVDFKTDRVTPDTLAGAVENYYPQMQAYREALSIMLVLTPDQIRARLLFVESGQTVDLPDESTLAAK